MKIEPTGKVPISPKGKHPAITDGDMVEVQAHTRGKAKGKQGHPNKAKQPLNMKWLDR